MTHAKVQSKIDELDVFPGHICIRKCHSDKFDAQNYRTMPRPDFKMFSRK